MSSDQEVLIFEIFLAYLTDSWVSRFASNQAYLSFAVWKFKKVICHHIDLCCHLGTFLSLYGVSVPAPALGRQYLRDPQSFSVSFPFALYSSPPPPTSETVMIATASKGMSCWYKMGPVWLCVGTWSGPLWWSDCDSLGSRVNVVVFLEFEINAQLSISSAWQVLKHCMIANISVLRGKIKCNEMTSCISRTDFHL